MPLRTAVRLALVAGAWLAGLPATAERWLWTSPSGDTEVVDQSQTEWDGYGGMQNGSGVGQSFVPAVSTLERLDLMLVNRYDRRPFTLRLWEWVDADADGRADDAEHAATVARAPLWTDRLALAGPPERQLVPFYPRIAIRPGVPHYLELSNDTGDGEWAAHVAADAQDDAYVAGRAWLNGRFQSVPETTFHVDLWFRTYGPPAGHPVPVTCEDTGEQAPCFSAIAPFVTPGPEGPPPTAADYREIVERYASYGRASILAADGHNAQEYAFYDAFLYRATGDETHAAWAIELLEHALAWREANPDALYSLFWGEFAGWAYRWIAASPGLTPERHASARRLLVLHAIGLEPKLEAGMENHAFACALTLKLVTDLVPAEEVAARSGGLASAADHARWRAYADGVWDEYKRAFDIWEDASQYHYFELRHILELAELYGEEALLWSSPAFRAFLDRVFVAHTPLGPYAMFGDTHGWNESWGTAAWVFERAARELRDPKYRWLAWRVFDYQRSHLRETNVDGTPIALWQAVYNEYPAFAHAYFAHDPTVPAVAPAGLAVAIDARQDAAGDTAWPGDRTRVGQTFVAQATPLVRITLRVRDRGAPVTAELRVWPWLGGISATTAALPLHAERFPIATTGAWSTIGFDLHARVDVGVPYFFAIEADGPFELAGSAERQVDRYPAGELWTGHQRRPDADLWFATSTLAGHGSAITDRLEAEWRRPSQYGDPLRPMDFTGARVPERLVLRSGFSRGDLQVVVNLIGGDYFHGQEETGAVLSLTDGGARLLADGTYFDRLDQYHSVPIVRRYTGSRRETIDTVSVPHFREGLRAVVAHVAWPDRDGWPVDLERRFLMVKNRFVLVRDRARFAAPLEASVGPLWTGYDLRPVHGPNWFEIYDREPRSIHGMRFANPERYLLAWLVPRPATTIDAWREIRAGNPPSPSYLVAQRFTGHAAAGDERWFDSLLVPHGPGVSAVEAAAAVSVLHDDGVAVALRVVLDGETWTIVDNPTGASIATPHVATDAAYAITRGRSGEPPYLFVESATFVRVVDGAGRAVERSWLVRASAEIGADRLPLRSGGRLPAVRPRVLGSRR